jgi:hypothetical protein
MRQLRVNSALLALALAPLVFAICVNITTGGSLAKALTGSNLWIFPFLVISGIVAAIYNYMQINEREKRGIRNPPVESIKAAKPTVGKVIRRLALTGNSESVSRSGQFDDLIEQPAPDTPPETVSLFILILAWPSESLDQGRRVGFAHGEAPGR